MGVVSKLRCGAWWSPEFRAESRWRLFNVLQKWMNMGSEGFVAAISDRA